MQYFVTAGKAVAKSWRFVTAEAIICLNPQGATFRLSIKPDSLSIMFHCYSDADGAWLDHNKACIVSQCSRHCLYCIFLYIFSNRSSYTPPFQVIVCPRFYLSVCDISLIFPGSVLSFHSLLPPVSTFFMQCYICTPFVL